MKSPALKPALASMNDAAGYLGMSRAQLYRVLPQLETVKIGRRNKVTVASMDRLIEASLIDSPKQNAA